jgi:hypothetical protein
MNASPKRTRFSWRIGWALIVLAAVLLILLHAGVALLILRRSDPAPSAPRTPPPTSLTVTLPSALSGQLPLSAALALPVGA